MIAGQLLAIIVFLGMIVGLLWVIVNKLEEISYQFLSARADANRRRFGKCRRP